MNYEQFKEKYLIEQGGREIGFAWADIQEYLLSPSKYKEFQEFMKGQTCGLLGGILGGISIIYSGDLYRFMKGLPNAD